MQNTAVFLPGMAYGGGETLVVVQDVVGLEGGEGSAMAFAVVHGVGEREIVGEREGGRDWWTAHSTRARRPRFLDPRARAAATEIHGSNGP